MCDKITTELLAENQQIIAAFQASAKKMLAYLIDFEEFLNNINRFNRQQNRLRAGSRKKPGGKLCYPKK
jgi:hypothetical protein